MSDEERPGCCFTLWYTILSILCLVDPSDYEYGGRKRRQEVDDMLR